MAPLKHRQLYLRLLHTAPAGSYVTQCLTFADSQRRARAFEETARRFVSIKVTQIAAPPCTAATIEGAAKNFASARQIVGALPTVENIASLINPPGSQYDEPAWISGILSLSGNDVLLDLHNVYTNAVNFGSDPFDFLARIPWNRVTTIHIAGGQWITSGASATPHRMLDDHLQDVPVPVYDLLRAAGARAPRPLTVILERDGLYPPIQALLSQLRTARNELAGGRGMQPRHRGVA